MQLQQQQNETRNEKHHAFENITFLKLNSRKKACSIIIIWMNLSMRSDLYLTSLLITAVLLFLMCYGSLEVLSTSWVRHFLTLEFFSYYTVTYQKPPWLSVFPYRPVWLWREFPMTFDMIMVSATTKLKHESYVNIRITLLLGYHLIHHH